MDKKKKQQRDFISRLQFFALEPILILPVVTLHYIDNTMTISYKSMVFK